MKYLIGIEYVCFGNNGRSPMAEAIATQEIVKRGLPIAASSSGCGLITAETHHTSATEKIAFIQEAYRNGLFTDYGREILPDAMQIYLGATPSETEIDRCWALMTSLEAGFRDQVLQEIGLQAAGCFQPTVAREGVHLLLPVNTGNAERVKKIYHASSYSPLIEIITAYAGYPQDLPVPFTHGIEEYRQIRDILREIVPITIERAWRELR